MKNLNPKQIMLVPEPKTGLTRGEVPELNLSNAAARDWWIDRCEKADVMENVDGLFMDVIMVSYMTGKTKQPENIYPPNRYRDGP